MIKELTPVVDRLLISFMQWHHCHTVIDLSKERNIDIKKIILSSSSCRVRFVFTWPIYFYCVAKENKIILLSK